MEKAMKKRSTRTLDNFSKHAASASCAAFLLACLKNCGHSSQLVCGRGWRITGTTLPRSVCTCILRPACASFGACACARYAPSLLTKVTESFLLQGVQVSSGAMDDEPPE